MRVTNNVNKGSFCSRNIVITFPEETVAMPEKVAMLVNKYKKVLDLDAPITPFIKLESKKWLVLDADTLAGKIFLEIKKHFLNLTFNDAKNFNLEAKTANLIANNPDTAKINYDEFISFHTNKNGK